MARRPPAENKPAPSSREIESEPSTREVASERSPRSIARRRPAEIESESSVLTGQLLVAMPGLEDPRFARAVIFVCAHTPEGAMGIVVNRPIDTPSFDDLLKQLDLSPIPPARRIRLCAGGPVDDGRGFVLHTTDWTGDNSLRVSDELALTASLDVLKAIAEGGGPREGVLALGYAGWEPGQLDAEMHQNAWLSVPADETIVFDVHDFTKWRRALAKLNVDPALLSGLAGHA